MLSEEVTWIESSEAQSLFSQARKATALPKGWPEPKGWQLNTVDPMKLLRVFPTIRLREGYVLLSYLYGSPNSNGIVWAFPEGASQPAPKERGFRSLPDPPPGVVTEIADIMALVEGDHSAQSYFSASLFCREVVEIGASWHGLDWHTHTLVTVDPWAKRPPGSSRRTRDVDREPDPRQPWDRLSPKPEEWRPSVATAQSEVCVAFYTYSALGQAAIWCHRDRYRLRHYEPAKTAEIIASGGGGYVF